MDLLSKTKSTKDTGAMRKRLFNVISRAASLEERINGSFLDSNENNTVSDEKLKTAWVHSIAIGSEEKFAEWLSFMNWSEKDFLKALNEDVKIKDEANLPDWATTLLQLFLDIEAYYLQEDEIKNHVENNETHNILFPFLKIAEKHVITESDRLGLGITYTSGSQMVMVLKQRLIALTVSLIDSEIYLNNITAAFQSDSEKKDLNSFESWLTRVETYPVIAKLIAISYSNWAVAITEFMSRLVNDKIRLSDTFFNGEDLGLLIKYFGDAGDVHCDGRSVVLLTFEGGKKIVYKPKDLSIANTYFTLLDELNPHLSLSLLTRKVDVRESYTWEEFIEYKECTSTNQFNDFYKRLGMITRLFQLLGARDFWLDNLIAHGNQPVFIDLEMVIQNLKEEKNDLLLTEQIALEQIEESVMKIGIVSLPTPIGFGVKFEDLGALTAIKKFSSPFKLDLTTNDQLGFEMEKSKDGYISWEKDDYLPRVGSVYAKTSDYMEDFLAGYEEMNTVLVQLKDKLLQKDSAIRLFDKSLLRYIHRDTWTYMRLIKNSYHSQALISGLTRDKFMFSLYSETWEDDHTFNIKNAYVLDHEITSILNLDVPLFNAIGGNCDLPTTKKVIPNYFKNSSKNLIEFRLNNIVDFDVSEHKKIILSNYFGGTHELPKINYKTINEKQYTSKDWEKFSIECAQIIINQAITNTSIEKSWIGIDYHPEMDANMLAVLKPDIFSGTCGLSMLFTDLYRAFKDPIYKDFAIGSLQSTLAAIDKSKENFETFIQEWHTSSKPLIVGAYIGIGSQIIALEYCTQYIKETNLEKALEQYVSAIPFEKLVKNSSSDFITGFPGLLFSLINYVDKDLLLNLSNSEHKKIKCIPEEAVLKTQLQPLEKGIEYFQFLLNQENKSIFNLTNSATLAELIVGLEYLKLNKYDKNIRSCYDLFLATLPKKLRTTQLIEYADLSLNLYGILNEEGYFILASSFAKELVNRKTETGEWFSDIWASENYYLSVLYGTGALSHLFLRLSKNGTFGSFRQLSTLKNI
jgi:type 2 lantibiotic biosynthesis protein LanM